MPFYGTCQGCGVTFSRAARAWVGPFCSRPCAAESYRHPKLPLDEALWGRVDRSGGADACWTWTAGVEQDGYGILWRGKTYLRAHRVSWELAHGPIPEGMNVLHRCDVPACVNPAHLFLGTQQDNVADRHAKGRDATGLRNGKHTHPERTPRGDAHPMRIRAKQRRGLA